MVPNQKRKMCLVSTLRSTKLLNICSDIYGDELDYCHYKYTNTVIEKMIESLEVKLKEYTYNDFCIWMIGEEDFKSSQDYNKLIT